jgi:hypothetical protein
LQGQAGVAAFFSALGELLKSPSKFLVCVHSEILNLVRDERLLDDTTKSGGMHDNFLGGESGRRNRTTGLEASSLPTSFAELGEWT